MTLAEKFFGVDGWRSSFESVDRVLRHYGRKVRSEHTRMNFLGTLTGFCKYVGYDDPNDLVKLSPQEASRLVQDFIDSLRERDLSIRYVNVSLAYLKTFFRVNGFKNSMELEVERYYQPSRYMKQEEYIPTAEENYKMAYAAGSTRNKALILALYTSGLRNSTLRALLYRDVKEELKEGFDIIKVLVYPEMKKVDPGACKGNIPYYSFLSKEAVEVLREYLVERRTVYGNIEDDEPLFISETTNIAPDKRRQIMVMKKSLSTIVKRAAKQAGIKKWEAVTPHCLRKNFESALRNSGLDVKDQEFLMGHILPGSQDTYYDQTKVEDLRRKYAQVNFFSQRGFITEEMRKRQLLDTARLLGYRDERFRRLQEVLARAKNVDEAIEKFRRFKEPPRSEKNDVKIVKGEKALVDHLKKGWTLAKELNHDKYLLKIDQFGEAEK